LNNNGNNQRNQTGRKQLWNMKILSKMEKKNNYWKGLNSIILVYVMNDENKQCYNRMKQCVNIERKEDWRLWRMKKTDKPERDLQTGEWWKPTIEQTDSCVSEWMKNHMGKDHVCKQAEKRRKALKEKDMTMKIWRKRKAKGKESINEKRQFMWNEDEDKDE